MRKLVAYELLSLDGVAEEPLDFITDFDDVMIDNLGRVIATQDTVLLGRRTYDQWSRTLAEERHSAVLKLHKQRREVRRDRDAA